MLYPPSLHLMFLVRKKGIDICRTPFIASHVLSEKEGGRYMPNLFYCILCFWFEGRERRHMLDPPFIASHVFCKKGVCTCQIPIMTSHDFIER
jgi:hypothetical protein